MNITFQHRAEIALRSLEPMEKEQINKVIKLLIKFNSKEALNSNKIHKLSRANELTKEGLYSYRANNRLRLIMSVNNDDCVIEDIVDCERLNKFSLH